MKRILSYRNLTFCFYLLIIGFPSACSSVPSDDYSHYLRNKNIAQPALNALPHCYDYGCQTIKTIVLPDEDWQTIQALFEPAAPTPEKEREQISQVIELFERQVGAITGTENDKRGTFRVYQQKGVHRFQQDCIDESTNTTLYLALLHKEGLLKHHRVRGPHSRMPFTGGAPWWHQTAAVVEIETGKAYAIDSWFHDNGHPAYIIPLDEWIDGWLPSKHQKQPEE